MTVKSTHCCRKPNGLLAIQMLPNSDFKQVFSCVTPPPPTPRTPPIHTPNYDGKGHNSAFPLHRLSTTWVHSLYLVLLFPLLLNTTSKWLRSSCPTGSWLRHVPCAKQEELWSTSSAAGPGTGGGCWGPYRLKAWTGLLETAKDWQLMADLGRQLRFPGKNCGEQL